MEHIEESTDFKEAFSEELPELLVTEGDLLFLKDESKKILFHFLKIKIKMIFSKNNKRESNLDSHES